MRAGGLRDMNVLLVNGSLHEQGCTDTALQEAGRMLEQAGIRTTRFWIGSEPLAGCSGCGYCARAGKCCHDDRVNVFLDAAKDADGFIFGAPVHFASASASMIAFLDRSFYADHCAGLNRFAFKPGAAIVSARRAGTSAALTSRSPEKLNAMVAEFPKQAMVIARPSRKVSRHKCGNCLIPISLRRCV